MVCALSLLAPGELTAASAAAPESQVRFDIPAGPAEMALAALAQAARISIGWEGRAPAFPVKRLSGTMTAAEALRRILAGSGYQAVRVGPTAWRIRPLIAVPPPPPPPPRAPVKLDAAPALVPEGAPLPELPPGVIVVTGQKRTQPIGDVPLSLALVDLSDTRSNLVPPDNRDIALSVEGLALTNLGPGRNRQFIRGVADSPFNGPSQSTVTVELDEARVTFDAPDPDLRLVDMDRVEILKGPQGPLHGSGALGGIYHIVTRKPDLTSFGGEIVFNGQEVGEGGYGGGGEGVVNLPIVQDKLALRVVGYASSDSGWIDNIGRNKNANSTTTAGGRLALRWAPAPNWTIDLSGTTQNVDSHDSQYVLSSDDTIKRQARIPEPAENDFKVVAATVQGRIGGLKLLAAASYIDHNVDYTLDSSDASAAFGLTGNSRFYDDRRYTIANYEIRLSPADSSHWLAGLSYLDTTTLNVATITADSGTITVENIDHRVRELAAFGETSLRLFDKVTATAGARLFRTIADDEASEQTVGRSQRVTQNLLSPSLSLSWAADARTIVYLRYARAVRPGGLAPAGAEASGRFDSDDLGTFDLGIRSETPNHKITYSAAAFYTDWDHIQSDYLLPNGLISTRNAGNGRIYGVEASARWNPIARFQLSAGATWVDAKLTRGEDGVTLRDRHLPVTPDVTARLSAQYRFRLAGWVTQLSAQANYTGAARLALDDNLDRKMGNYVTTAGGIFATRDRLTIGARLDNILDVRGDSFAFGNPFSILLGRQYTPLRPRTLTLSAGYAW
jgi:outer membrane receptor protein involved in Fe transport